MDCSPKPTPAVSPSHPILPHTSAVSWETRHASWLPCVHSEVFLFGENALRKEIIVFFSYTNVVPPLLRPIRMSPRSYKKLVWIDKTGPFETKPNRTVASQKTVSLSPPPPLSLSLSLSLFDEKLSCESLTMLCCVIVKYVSCRPSCDSCCVIHDPHGVHDVFWSWWIHNIPEVSHDCL